MKLSRVYLVFCIAFFGVFAVLSFGQDVFAATPQYQQLENIPGYEGNKSFPEYVNSIYNLALWIVGISAMFMLSVGGFMYLTSAGNTSSASTAKGVIKDALIGLVLGLSAWLIVNTINPDLTALNVSGIGTGTSVPIPPPVSGSLKDLANAVSSNKLATTGECKDAAGKSVSPASNITEVKNGQSMTACYNGCNKPSSAACTNKVNPPAAMLSTINNVNSNYQITSISGGSHAANSAHYGGNAIDVVPGSSNKADWVVIRNDFITKGAMPNNPNGSGTMCEGNDGSFKMDCVGADHIHVRF